MVHTSHDHINSGTLHQLQRITQRFSLNAKWYFWLSSLFDGHIFSHSPHPQENFFSC